MDIRAASLALHYRLQGKLEMVSRCPIQTQEDLSLAYTPGVAAPCLEIQKDPALSFQLTRRRNLVAVITDGSAVLGLGDIGPLAGMPVMEGKCVLFKEFAGVDATKSLVRVLTKQIPHRAKFQTNHLWARLSWTDVSVMLLRLKLPAA